MVSVFCRTRLQKARLVRRRPTSKSLLRSLSKACPASSPSPRAARRVRRRQMQPHHRQMLQQSSLIKVGSHRVPMQHHSANDWEKISVYCELRCSLTKAIIVATATSSIDKPRPACGHHDSYSLSADAGWLFAPRCCQRLRSNLQAQRVQAL